MRLHRFYIEEYQGNWGEGVIVVSEKSFVNQLKSVLRYATGDHFIGFCENKDQYEMEIVSIDRKSVTAQFIKKVAPEINEGESSLANISMHVSLIKKDRFEWLVEKLTELGIKKIVPIISQRTTTKNISVERLEKISKEAIEQSGQIRLVGIDNPQKLSDALSECKGEIYFLHTTGVKGAKIRDTSKEWNIFIGPEGGWNENDIELFEKYNATVMHFDMPVLRTETAAIVAATLCLK